MRLLDDGGDAGVGPVHLVDDDDDGQVRGERLAEHEAGLREGALGRVDEQHDAVDHAEPALHLAAEVRVARGVDHVDRHGIAASRRAGVPDRGVLREDRDALLALEVAGVHRALVDVGVLAERAALPEHGVDERRLAVVDVGHDGDVAPIGAQGHVGTRFVGGDRRPCQGGRNSLPRGVDDLAVARHPAKEPDRHGHGAQRVRPVHRLKMHVRLGAIARVPAAPHRLARRNTLTTPHPDAALLEVADRNDRSARRLDHDVVSRQRDPSARHPTALTVSA